MLEIKKVSKQYKTGDLVQNALSLTAMTAATLLSTVFPQNNTQAATGILTETIPSGSFFRVTI